MSLDRWNRVKAVFDGALGLAPAAREAYLASECESDAALRAEVDRLLAADEEADRFFDTLGRDIRDAAPEVVLPERLGPWQVVREIGHGGMGQVLLAERADGQYTQSAAIKLVHPGLSPDAVARFRAERQMLARLDHPRIARLLDGGVAPDGRPYLVMEYVEGEPITRYADRHRLPVTARLELFRQVCDAVAYAHTRLVVHRDIKPSNVLVTPDAGPAGAAGVKLLDFGIARLLADDADGGVVTQADRRLMTPAYAAPEQVRGEPVTTSTDVYSLGVLLYELLAGHRPHRPPTGSSRDMELAILDRTPPDPSAAVGRTEERRLPDGSSVFVTPESVAAARATEPPRLRRRLRGDLDRIVMKALRTEPERRYPTAEAFARDIDRHLAGIPVEARPSSLAYRARSFIGRHRAGVTAAAAVVVLAAAFGALYTLRVARERDRAEAERDRAERVTRFLTEMLAPAADLGVPARPMLRLLEPALARADRELGDDPEALGTVYHTLGRLYEQSGRPDRALPVLRRALALRRAAHDGPNADVAATMHALGNHFVAVQRDSALAYFRDAARMRQAISPADDHDLAWSLLQWSRLMPVEDGRKATRFEEAMAMFRRLHGDRSREVGDALHEYHVLGLSGATADQIEAAFREALAIYAESSTEESTTAIHTLHNLGLLVDRDGTRDEALEMLRRSVELGRRTLPPGAPGRLTMAVNYGATLLEHGRPAEADEVLRDAVDEARFTLPDSSSGLGHAQYWHGRNLLALGRTAEAEAHLGASATLFGRLDSTGTRYHRARMELAAAIARQGRRDEAVGILRTAAVGLRGTPLEETAIERLRGLGEESPAAEG